MDVSIETPLSLKDVANLVGKHIATVYRWSTVGIRGVVLETLQIGGTRFTSREALQRFCERLTLPDTRHVTPTASGATNAGRELERYGV